MFVIDEKVLYNGEAAVVWNNPWPGIYTLIDGNGSMIFNVEEEQITPIPVYRGKRR